MEIILTILLLFTRLLKIITDPYFQYKGETKKKYYLPALKNDLLRISATKLSEKIREKKISSLEICEIYIERIKEVNPIINAVVEERFRIARREAKLVDGYIKTTSLNLEEIKKIKPLLGVPVTVKESCAVKGMSLCVGLHSRIGYKAESDGEIVARLKRSGAIILLISTTPELCSSFETYNFVTGCTNNPYDTSCTSGGSSGGEGALLGSAASLVGIGSDFSGSIRLPALYNGVFGHKPSPRVTSLKGHFPLADDTKLNDFLVIGPLTRYACDLKLMLKVMCSDKTVSELKLNENVDLKNLKVFGIEELDGSFFSTSNCCTEMKSILHSSVKYLHKICGVKIEDNDKFEFLHKNNVLAICASQLCSIKNLPNPLKWENANLWIELFKASMGKSRFTLQLLLSLSFHQLIQSTIGNYENECTKLKQEIMDNLGTNGVILLPTSTGPAPKHSQMYFQNFFAYLFFATVLGLPSTAVPCGFDKNGMPIGVQVIAAPSQDRLCLAVAEELERYFGGWISPPQE